VNDLSASNQCEIMEKGDILREERRKFKRKTASFVVTYSVDSSLLVQLQKGKQTSEATALDFSQSGMAVLTEFSIPRGSLVDMRFVIPQPAEAQESEQGRSIQVIAEAIYSFVSEDNKQYRLGLRFLGMKLEDREFIAHFLEFGSSGGDLHQNLI